MSAVPWPSRSFRSIWITFSRLLAERNVVALSKESGNEMSNISSNSRRRVRGAHRIETQCRELGLEWTSCPSGTRTRYLLKMLFNCAFITGCSFPVSAKSSDFAALGLQDRYSHATTSGPEPVHACAVVGKWFAATTSYRVSRRDRQRRPHDNPEITRGSHRVHLTGSVVTGFSANAAVGDRACSMPIGLSGTRVSSLRPRNGASTRGRGFGG